MGLLRNILKKKKSNYKQSDNKGIFHSDEAAATEYWLKRKELKKFEPFLLYKFTDEGDAVRALLEVECIKIAEDTEEIICTEPLVYGYYPVETGDYEVVLCGSSLSESLFNSTKIIFEANNGKKINEKSPADKEIKINPALNKKIEIENKPAAEHAAPVACKVYSAPSAAKAISFLEKKLVTPDSPALMVKTPEGNFCKNTHGIFKVDLPD